MKKILVPTDLTPKAELGLKLATEIAKRCSATVSLVNFTRHPYGSTFSATGDVMMKRDPETDLYTIELLKNIKVQLEELVSRYADPGLKIQFEVVDNYFKNGIDEYLKAEQVDLIVMGTSGEENAKEIFTGNHTEQAIRVSACPVLSVRDGFDPSRFDRIVVGVDVITDNKLADGLTNLKGLADCFGSKLHLVHVRDKASDSTLILDEYFNQIAQIAGLTNYTVRILEADEVTDGLSNYAREIKAGLVAIVKNSKEGIFRIFSNPISDRMIKEEGRPVVTVKA